MLTSNVLLHVRQAFREHSLEQGADGGLSGKPLMGVIVRYGNVKYDLIEQIETE